VNKFIIAFLNYIFKSFGFTLIKVKEQEKEQKYIQFLEDLQLKKPFSKVPNHFDKDNFDLTFIVFSKDRAIQLHALLNSFYTHVSGSVTVHVLYYTSTPEHQQAYYQVQEIFQNRNIVFTKEQHFREDLIKVVTALSVSKVVFLVDDIIFTEPLDIREFAGFDTDKFVPTLRMGNHLKFNYTHQRAQPLPKFITPADINNKDLIVWKWSEGVFDWFYPLSVDGHLFSLHEIKCMLPLLNFKAPNSFEEAMQVFKPFYLKKLGLAYKKSKIVNIPCNKVQVENNNLAEEVTVDFLLEKWQAGLQIDYLKFSKFNNNSAHQFLPFDFVPRPRAVN